MDCISPCPTGSIDTWRMMPKARAYSIEEQLKWDELPAELSAEELAAAGGVADTAQEQAQTAVQAAAASSASAVSTAVASGFNSALPLTTAWCAQSTLNASRLQGLHRR